MSAGAVGGDVISDVVALRYGSRCRVAHLRELRGTDEDLLSSSSGGTIAALTLLRRLLVAPAPGDDPPLAEDFTIADRDRVLAAVHRRIFGTRVSSTVRCVACESPFDLEFSLLAFEKALDKEARGAATQLAADGTITLEGGRRFRLPTGRDEVNEIAADAPTAAARMLEACALGGTQAGDLEIVPPLMRACAPLLDSDLDGTCPECQKAQTMRFDLQTYLLAALAGESRRLTTDVHRIATTYGWSRSEILALTRAQRRAHVALIEQESRPRRRVRS